MLYVYNHDIPSGLKKKRKAWFYCRKSYNHDIPLGLKKKREA